MNQISEVCQILNYDSMEINELNDELNKECDNIGRKFYKFTRSYNNVGDTLNSAFYRDSRHEIIYESDFNNIEQLEFEIDQLFYSYKKIKEVIKDVRLGNLILRNKKNEGSINENRVISENENNNNTPLSLAIQQ